MAVVRAHQTFVTFVDGVRTVVAEGAIYDSADKVVKEHKEQFTAPEAATRKPAGAAKRPTLAKD